MTIHPLVRDLYKRVLIVSRDYPNSDHHHVKQLWKTAIRNPENCPSWYITTTNSSTVVNDITELYQAVHRGRHMVKEMIGIVQLHKYRSMKKRYSSSSSDQTTGSNNNNNNSVWTTMAATESSWKQYQNGILSGDDQANAVTDRMAE